MNQNIISFIFDLTNSVIGAFLGFLLAMYLQSRTDRKASKKQINAVMASLREELLDLSESLREYIDIREALEQRIPMPILDAIMHSGVILEMAGTPIYSSVVCVYSLIERFNETWQNCNSDKILEEMREIAKVSGDIVDSFAIPGK